MKIYIPSLFFFLIFISCSPKKAENSGGLYELTKLLVPNESTLSVNYENDKFSNKRKVATVTLESGLIIDDGNFNDTNLVSISALIFFKEERFNELKNIDSLRILLKHKTIPKEDIQITYSYETLEKVSSFEEKLKLFMVQLEKKNYTVAYAFFTKETKQLVSLDDFVLKMGDMNTQNGDIISYKTIGFKFYKYDDGVLLFDKCKYLIETKTTNGFHNIEIACDFNFENEYVRSVRF